MAAEWQKNLREFDIDLPSNPTEVGVIEALKAPTRIGADLSFKIGPRLWYGEAYKGNFSSDEFRERYFQHAALNPDVRSPYTYLTSDWDPKPITENRTVYNLMGALSGSILSASNYINNVGRGESTVLSLAEHLRIVSKLCLDGDFDGLMKVCVEQDQSYPVGYGFVLAETYNDPMKDRPEPQSWLTYKDKKSTERATRMIAKLRDASGQLTNELGYPITPRQAQVVVANVLILSGYLAEVNTETSKFRDPSGFNLPNDPTVTDKSLIYLFKGRIEAKNKQLAKKLQTHLGISSEPIDLETLVTGHEFAHGYHEGEEELQRYGSLNQVARELMANDLAATLVGSGAFHDEFQRRFVRGLLAYSVDDVEGMITVIRNPKIADEISINDLMDKIGDYGLVGLVTLREARESNAIKLNDGKPATIDYRKLFEQAKNRFIELSNLARSGNPDRTEKFFRKRLSGLHLYPVVKPETLAS